MKRHVKRPLKKTQMHIKYEIPTFKLLKGHPSRDKRIRNRPHKTINWHYLMGCAMQKVSLGICRQRRPRSACASAQSDQGLHCPLTESLDTTECMNGDQRPEWYLAHVQDDLNQRIFSHIQRHFLAWCDPSNKQNIYIYYQGQKYR